MLSRRNKRLCSAVLARQQLLGESSAVWLIQHCLVRAVLYERGRSLLCQPFYKLRTEKRPLGLTNDIHGRLPLMKYEYCYIELD